MGRVYAWFLSLFPLLTGIGLLLVSLDHEDEIPLSPEVSVPRAWFQAAGALCIAVALGMMLLSRRVERLLYKVTNWMLPEGLRRPLPEPPAPAPAAPRGASASQTLKRGRDYELSRDYVLTSHSFPARVGLLTGSALLLPTVAEWVAFFFGHSLLPAVGIVDILVFIMFIVGIGILGKRHWLRVCAREGVLEDWGRVWWHERCTREPLDKFDRVIIKRWNVPGFGGRGRARHSRRPRLGVRYLVQLGGSGLRTLNHYSDYADARDLALTLAEITRLPLREPAA